jgi:hypothetical protein
MSIKAHEAEELVNDINKCKSLNQKELPEKAASLIRRSLTSTVKICQKQENLLIFFVDFSKPTMFVSVSTKKDYKKTLFCIVRPEKDCEEDELEEIAKEIASSCFQNSLYGHPLLIFLCQSTDDYRITLQEEFKDSYISDALGMKDLLLSNEPYFSAQQILKDSIFEGGNRCHYIVKWSETSAFRFKQARNIVLILFILAGIGLTFLGKTLAVPAILSLLIATLCFCWFAENKEKNHFKNELTQFTNIHTSYNQLLTTTSDFAEMLKDIGEAIGNAENVENIVDAFLMPLKERLDFDYGIVLLSDRDNTTLRYTKGFGLTKESENILGNASVLLNNPNTFNHYFVRSYRLKQPVVMNELKDAAKIAEDQKVVDVLKAGAFIVCPIIHADKALGVLAVFQKEKKRELIQRDVNVLMGVTSTIGAHISKKNE